MKNFDDTYEDVEFSDEYISDLGGSQYSKQKSSYYDEYEDYMKDFES